jgi:hypothetical protein
VLILLLGQFALGMAVNLYARIPSQHSGAHPTNYLSGSVHSVGWAISSGPAVLAAHAALGLLLVLVALHVLARAIRTRRRATTVAAVLGAAFIVGAGFNGASFLDFNDNVSSLIMSMLFALAVLAYISALAIEAKR